MVEVQWAQVSESGWEGMRVIRITGPTVAISYNW